MIKRIYIYIYDFFVDYNTIDVREFADIHKYLLRKT